MDVNGRRRLLDEISQYEEEHGYLCPLSSLLEMVGAACEDALVALTTSRPRMAALFLGLISYPLEKAIEKNKNLELNFEAKLKQILQDLKRIEYEITNYKPEKHSIYLDLLIELSLKTGYPGRTVDLLYYFSNVDEEKKRQMLKDAIERHRDVIHGESNSS